MSEADPDSTATAGAPKFRRRAEARPDEVLDAALALFVAQGYGHTTVDQIARRAGLSKGAVYLYFPSKKALLEGLVRRAIGPVAGFAQGMPAHFRGDPRPLIARFLRLAADALTDPHTLAVPKLVVREAMAAPEIAQIYRDEVLARALPALQALIAQGVAGGFIRRVDPEMAARCIMGPLVAHLLLSEVFGVIPEGGLALDRLIETHLAILDAGLEPMLEGQP
ncbi:MAG: TetR/AcrR family transcriptional regulator [Alphaproteobacteria bacterium HGW-Alphaproteobacteria-4]|jgi:AcrR family transcriptional regulator|nr:MAG: TetR/AcrR family transcriptional regulator [Alphaproteobacteria bacterium HGW-Alphaproteobacteria-4]